MKRRLKLILEFIFNIIGIDFKFLSYEQRFTIKNRKFWKQFIKGTEIDKNKYIVAECSENLFITISTVILAVVLAKVKRTRILFLGLSTYPSLHYQKLRTSFYKNNKLEIVEKVISDKKDLIEKKTEEIYLSLKTPEDILKISFSGLYIGDIIYDEAMRVRPWQATVHKIDERVKITLRKAIEIIICLDILTEKYNIVSCVFSHNIGNIGLQFRYFTNRKIESYSGAADTGFIKKYTDFNSEHNEHVFEIDKESLFTLLSDNLIKEKILTDSAKYISERLIGNINDTDVAGAFSSKKRNFKDKNEFNTLYGLDGNKKNVFIMMHAFNDYPHHFNNKLFTDYYVWFIETLKFAIKKTDVNWIFKEHPSSLFYPDDANLRGIFDVVDCPHILFLDYESSFNSASLPYVAHAIITSNGTAALEFTCSGVPAVLAGSNHFSGFGLCIEPQTKQEYFEELKNVGRDDLNNFITEDLKNLAKIIFFIQYGSYNSGEFGMLLPLTSIAQRLDYNVENWLETFLNNINKTDITVIFKDLENFFKDLKMKNYLLEQFIKKYKV